VLIAWVAALAVGATLVIVLTRGDGSVPGDAGPRSEGSDTSAAQMLGWGQPNRVEDFNDQLTGWELYDGPGHNKNGLRKPGAIKTSDGVLTITGDGEGSTGGMSWGEGQKYGRWEGRVRAPASDPSYNALLLLWPDTEEWPRDGEIDFMEMTDPARQSTDIFIHYSKDGTTDSQVHSKVDIDGTQWHNWAVEWTPEHIVAYVDGKKWYRTTDTSVFPPGPMHLTIQLDWFPENRKGDVKTSTMEVDWVKQYPI